MHNISFLQNENLPSFAQFCISDSRYEDLRTHFTKKTYRAGECVQSEGDTITHFGIVVSGILKAAIMQSAWTSALQKRESGWAMRAAF